MPQAQNIQQPPAMVAQRSKSQPPSLPHYQQNNQGVNQFFQNPEHYSDVPHNLGRINPKQAGVFG